MKNIKTHLLLCLSIILLIACAEQKNSPKPKYFCNISGAYTTDDTCYCPVGTYNFPDRVCKRLDSMDFVADLPANKFTYGKLVLSIGAFEDSVNRKCHLFSENNYEDLPVYCENIKSNNSLKIYFLQFRGYKKPSNKQDIYGIIYGKANDTLSIDAKLYMYDNSGNAFDSIPLSFHK